MGALDRIAHFQNRRDEVPNQQLARELAAQRDRDGICEIAENLWNHSRAIQADCLKVLYEIGYLDPGLIAEYGEDFVRLLHSHNNRLVWGGMIALRTIAELRPQVVLAHLDEIEEAIDKGSAITVDSGIEALARAASKDERCLRAVLPYLINHLSTCRARDLPQHAEKSLCAINGTNKSRFIGVLTRRLDELSGAGLARVKNVLKEAQAR